VWEEKEEEMCVSDEGERRPRLDSLRERERCRLDELRERMNENETLAALYILRDIVPIMGYLGSEAGLEFTEAGLIT
jgi:hypothetical protein